MQEKSSTRKRGEAAAERPSGSVGPALAVPVATMSSSAVPELPVFTFPNALNFYADDKDSLRQILTIYNPYEFALKFRVYCTAPKLFSVVDAQGTIRPGYCSDMDTASKSFGCFSQMIYDSVGSGSQSVGKLLGKKTLESMLLEKRPITADGGGDDENDGEFAQLPSVPSSSQASTTSRAPRQVPIQWQPGQRLPFGSASAPAQGNDRSTSLQDVPE